MAENGEAQQQPQVQMNILGQFIRDMSFENVMAQKGTGRRGSARRQRAGEPGCEKTFGREPV